MDTVTRVVKYIFGNVLNSKCKILLKIVFEILLSNTFDFTQKIQNTKYLRKLVEQ